MDSIHTHLAIALTTAYLLADFALPVRVASVKRTWLSILGHGALAAGLSYGLAGLWHAWPIPAIVFLAHGLIDRHPERRGTVGWVGFLLQLVAHGLVIAGLVFLVPRWLSGALSPVGSVYRQVLVAVSGLILSVGLGADVVGRFMDPFLREMEQEQASRATVEASRTLRPRQGFEQGGRVIGMLERAMIFLLVLAEAPTAVGFLITAKSILRFGDIGKGASRKEVEYILVGSLMSFLFGLATAYATSLILRSLAGCPIP